MTPAKKNLAAGWFAKALQHAADAQSLQHEAKHAAIVAGWHFIQAKLAAAHGEFEALCAASEARLNERTVQRYMAFTRDALVSVVAARESLTDAQVRELELTPAQLADKDLFAATKQVVVHSTVGYVALARELKLFRQFGAYDAVAHQIRKASPGDRQLSFSFGIAETGLRSIFTLETVSDAKLPPPEQLDQLEQALLRALNVVRTRRGQKPAINVDARPPRQIRQTGAPEPSGAPLLEELTT